MSYVEARTDAAHLDDMLVCGLQSGLLDALPGSSLVTEENGGKIHNDPNPYTQYQQELESFAHTVGFTFDTAQKAEKLWTAEETEAFLKELDETFHIRKEAQQAPLSPEDEKALAALSVCGFERIHACTYLNFGFGRLPRQNFPKLNLYRDSSFVHHKLYENKQYIWMVYVTSDSYAAEVKQIFASLYFEPIEIPEIDVGSLLEQYQDRLNAVYASCRQKAAILEGYQYIAQIDSQEVLAGFVEQDRLSAYEQSFRDLPVQFTVKDPQEVPQHACPTKLHNSWFARPFELFVEMYSLPKYGGFDPTLFFAVTYSLLFGIMFGDMGQGLVLMAIGFLFEKKSRLFGIIGRAGIFSTVFGFLFGSFFGYEDLLNPIHQHLFHVRDKLFDVMDSSNTMALLMGAMLVGSFLIMASQMLNIICHARRKEWDGMLFGPNGIAGLVFYAYVLACAAQELSTGSAALLSLPGILLCIVLPIFCFLFQEPLGSLVMHRTVRPQNGWGGYITQSIFEVLENLLSFVTNSMSYLRVGGFVLSHAGMMLVVMTLMDMIGGAGSWVVLVFGNAFVMVLEGLVVGIQALRLEYYEMFSRYYQGGGRAFVPTAALQG